MCTLLNVYILKKKMQNWKRRSVTIHKIIEFDMITNRNDEINNEMQK